MKKCVTAFVVLLLVLGNFALPASSEPLTNNRLDIYHLDGCKLPCWIGIVPGKTTLRQTLKLVEDSYPPSEYRYKFSYNSFWDVNWITLTDRQTNHAIWISFDDSQPTTSQTPDTIVSQIENLTDANNLPSLADWIIELGAPQALSTTWGNHVEFPNVLYCKQRLRLTLNNRGDDFVVNSPSIAVAQIDIYADLAPLCPPNAEYTVPWQGWTTNYKDQLRHLGSG